MADLPDSSKLKFSPRWHPPYEPPKGVVIDTCQIGKDSPYTWPNSALPRWLRQGAAPSLVDAPQRAFRVNARDLLKVLAIAVCTALLGLSLPSFDTLDYWVGMAAFLIALVVVATL